jgi:hypothetical protein
VAWEPVFALSRRKQGFDPRWARQVKFYNHLKKNRKPHMTADASRPKKIRRGPFGTADAPSPLNSCWSERRAMRRIRPIKSKRLLEELLMNRLSADSVCVGITGVVVKWLPRSGPDVPNWQASYFRHGGLDPAALSAAKEIGYRASTEFDLEE